MKKSIKITAIIIFIISLTGCFAIGKNTNEIKKENRSLTMEEKVEDFLYMYEIIKENYPYLEVNKRVNDVDWLSNKEVYIEIIKESKSDSGFYIAMEGILKELHNGHVNMIDSESYGGYLELYSSIDGMEKWAEVLSQEKALERYNYSLPNKAKERSEKKREISYSYRDNIETKVLKEDKSLYIKVKSMNHLAVEENMKRIRKFLEDNEDTKGLIIDIRNNGGGSDYYWHSLVSMLIQEPLEMDYYMAVRGGEYTEIFYPGGYNKFKPIISLLRESLRNVPEEVYSDFEYYVTISRAVKPEDSINYKGKIFLLVNEGVFSSSEAFAVFSKATGFATLIGEGTSGDGIGSDPALCMLPNSGYIFRFTKEMGLNPDGSCNFEKGTIPNYVVDSSENKDIYKDASVNRALELIKVD